MNFQRGRHHEEIELNLIPLIDVLLVIIIFLMLTTTYSRYSGLEINLPTSQSEARAEQATQIDVAVNASGDIFVNKAPVGTHEIVAIVTALRRVVPENTKPPVLVISADAKASHQSVIDVMQAAQQAGLSAVTFATAQAK